MKVIICGPKESGKTSISNFLANSSASNVGSAEPYSPTIGCRILEFTQLGLDVELWDVSGSQQYEACWPAIMAPTSTKSTDPVDGVVLVYNPEIPTHDTEVGLWYDLFVKQAGLPDSKCLVFVHRVEPKGGYRTRAPPKLEGCKVINTTFESTIEVREAFDDFLRLCADSRK